MRLQCLYALLHLHNTIAYVHFMHINLIVIFDVDQPETEEERDGNIRMFDEQLYYFFMQPPACKLIASDVFGDRQNQITSQIASATAADEIAWGG